MKKFLLMVGVILITTANLLAEPTDKVINIFNAAFPTAQEVKWHEDDKGYLVSFTELGKHVKVMYDKDGVFVSALRYYDEKGLPLNILMAVKERYPALSVSSVTELTTREGVSWQINLEDDKKWYIVKATSDGTFEMKNKFRKQN